MVPAGEKAETRKTVEIAVLVPCYNEEAAIAKVVADFRAALPEATIYVYDNNSKDQTVARAARGRRRGAQRSRARARAMWCAACSPTSKPISMCWWTATTPMTPAPRPRMIAPHDRRWRRSSDRRARIHTDAAAYRPGHVLGNRLLTGLTALLFNVHLSDMLSGYRVFSRRFVKSFPFTAEGFAIETELTVHAVRLMMPMAEMDTRYKERPVGSVSKLNTYRDGFRILGTIGYLVREERPLVFFAVHLRCCSPAVAVLIGAPVVPDYFHTGLVPRLPTAVLATGLMVIAFLSLTCGLILDTVTRGRWEAKRMAYLAIPGPQDLPAVTERSPGQPLCRGSRLSPSCALR